jgi:hypothetical protein
VSDVVNHPPHYNQGAVECIQALESLGIAKDYCRANALKYLWRMADKGKALEDCRKAQWYVNRLVGYLESEAHAPFVASIEAVLGSHHREREASRGDVDGCDTVGDRAADTSSPYWGWEVTCGGGP